MDEAELPDRIGPYNILRKIGAGGMGTVYLGRQVDSGLEAAIKVLPASLAREPGTSDRFEREIDAMRKLTGPHIVKLYESGRDEETDQMYFAMEYVEGETLIECIRANRRLPWEQSVDIAIQICSALKAAHATGVIHRDLKPSNLLIGDDGIVKLTDFGVAQVFAAQRLTSTGGIIGTAEYMSPEQAQGRRCTRASDLYSLGAVLYAMLTGRPPFTGQNAVEIIQKHSTARFDRPSLYAPDVPRILEDVVCRLLEKKPEDRYSDAHVVSLRLKEVVKRVEFASRDETIAKPFESDGLMSPTATAPNRGSRRRSEEVTFASGLLESESRETGQPFFEGRHEGPGAATMVRDAFRADLRREQEKSPLAALFDNTWFLIGCLILLIAGGVFWMNGVRPDSSLDDDADFATDVAGVPGEVSRFMRLAKSYRRNGDTPREERLLTALRAVIADDKSNAATIREIDRRLESLAGRREQLSHESGLAKQTVDRAESLIDEGRVEEARSLLDSLSVLYRDDEDARPQLDRVTELLRQISLSVSEAESKNASVE
ncbi:MAG: protein kinase [Rhodopirellula sp.]|nr:protein kinase [Rhodopirellula sp.]